jgi:serine/threonine protein kinase/WD40 repeat protein
MNERELFIAALQKEDLAERSDYLESACGDDSELRHRLDELLQEHEQMNDFLESPPDELDSLTLPYLNRLAEPLLAPALSALGDYRILREVGRGGMGIVYEAEQVSLGRRVALKVLPRHSLLDPKRLQRFQVEARAAGRLHHTHIVPVYGVGEEDGLHYLVMQFIDGCPLDRVLDELRKLRRQSNPRESAPSGSEQSSRPPEGGRTSPLAVIQAWLAGRRSTREEGELTQVAQPADSLVPAANGKSHESQLDKGIATMAPRAGAAGFGAGYSQGVARIGIQVGAALDYAAQQGVLHRDIKPANLLLDRAGQVWVTDFGLAKLTDSDALTQTGEVIGTISYMAPERFQQDADARSDVYSLGLTLYELLTLQPAFEEMDRGRTMARILAADYPAPRRLNPAIPRDLETIVLKATAREPDRRYATSGELAEDLRRFLADHPIHARRVSTVERMVRWCRRNPLVATLSAALVLLLLTLIGGALVRNAELAHALQSEQAKRWESLRDRAQALRMSRRAGQRVESLRSLAEAVHLPVPAGHSLAELRTEAVAALALPDLEVVAEWPRDFVPGITSETVDNSLERYARILSDGTVTVSRVGDGQLIARWQETINQARPLDEESLRFSRDGRFLAISQDRARQLVVRQLDGQKPVVCFRCDNVNLDAGMDFTPDNSTLAYGTSDGRIAFVDLVSGRLVRSVALSDGGRASCLSFSPDGHRLAIEEFRAGQYTVEVRDSTTGQVVASFPHPLGLCSRPTWHPNGRTLATACSAHPIRWIRLWDTDTGRLLRTLEGHTNGGIRCAFDSRGQWLVSNDWGDRVRLWEVASGRQLLSFPAGGYNFLRTGPRDQLIVRHITDQNKLQLLQIHGGREYRTIYVDGLGPSAPSPRVDPEGRLIAVEAGNSVTLVNIATGCETARVPVPWIFPIDWSSAGVLLTQGKPGIVRWPMHQQPGESTRYCLGPPERLLPIRSQGIKGTTADGLTIAVPNSPRALGATLYHFGRERWTISLPDQQDVRFSAVSPDGRWVATGSHQNTDGFGAKVWDGRREANGRLEQKLPVPGLCNVSFSSQGRWLLTTGGGCRIWRCDRWTEGPMVGGAYGCFTPDEQLIAVGDTPGVIRLVETETGTELARLEAPEQSLLIPGTFTPNGEQLIAGGVDTSALHVWDLRWLQHGLRQLGLAWDAPPNALLGSSDSLAPPPSPVPAIPIQVSVDLGELAPPPQP